MGDPGGVLGGPDEMVEAATEPEKSPVERQMDALRELSKVMTDRKQAQEAAEALGIDYQEWLARGNAVGMAARTVLFDHEERLEPPIDAVRVALRQLAKALPEVLRARAEAAGPCAARGRAPGITCTLKEGHVGTHRDERRGAAWFGSAPVVDEDEEDVPIEDLSDADYLRALADDLAVSDRPLHRMVWKLYDIADRIDRVPLGEATVATLLEENDRFRASLTKPTADEVAERFAREDALELRRRLAEAREREPEVLDDDLDVEHWLNAHESRLKAQDRRLDYLENTRVQALENKEPDRALAERLFKIESDAALTKAGLAKWSNELLYRVTVLEGHVEDILKNRLRMLEDKVVGEAAVLSKVEEDLRGLYKDLGIAAGELPAQDDPS